MGLWTNGKNEMKLSHSILGSTFLFLSACGGGGGGTPTDVGVFVDAPVEGLAYESGGITGTTDSAGKFIYVVGQNVSFSVSGVTLPAVQGASLLTPVDLVGASSPDSPESVYIARFLQSIDSDGNPDNGIRIDKSKLKTGATTPANWNTDPLANLVSDAALAAAPTEAAARTHMKSQIAALSGLPRMSLVGRYTTGGTTASGGSRLYAEIISYHKLSKSAFITIDDSSTSKLTSFARISLSALPTTGMKTKSDDNNETVSTQNLTLGTPVNVATDVNDSVFTAGGVQSLDITGNLLAIAVANTTKNSNGVIAFYTLDANGAATFVRKVTVGALPDGVAFSPNGKYLVVANEGEPLKNSATSISDAEGSISIIAITDGLPATSATTLLFTDFNTGGSRASELPAGVRKVRQAATFSEDVEPEYVTISDDSKTAFVTLQEANAVAVVDLATARISKIHALGVKDFGQPKNKIWTNDSYSDCTSDTVCLPPTLKNYTNLFGYYMPDGVASFTIAGKTYFLTGNEGDDKDDNIETASAEKARISSIASSLDTTVFPLSVSTELARLNINKTANGSAVGVNSSGKYEKLFTYGARSFSIWDADTGALVFDSGDDFERVVYNDATPLLLNNNSKGLRDRMDDKGPEPENIVVGQVGKEYYAFIGLERTSGIMMYQITNPAKPKFVQYIRNTTNAATTGDISPEGLKFISAADSPTGVPLLMVGYEVTGSMAVFQIK
jgi:hypothetical protein